MTCIAAYVSHKGIIMGGDSAGVAGYHLVVRNDPKVFVRDDMIFGYTSSFRMGQLLRFKLAIPPHHPKDKSAYEYMCTDFIEAVRHCFEEGGFLRKKDQEESGGTFLVGYRGELFEIEDDFQVGQWSTRFAAVGCGAELAIGAMAAMQAITIADPMDGWDMVRIALETAEQFNAGVRGPMYVHILTPE